MTGVNKGCKIRICTDPRDLNNATCIQREDFLLKTVQDVIENMSQAKFFKLKTKYPSVIFVQKFKFTTRRTFHMGGVTRPSMVEDCI